MRKIPLLLFLVFFVNLGMASAANKKIIPPIKNIEWWETQKECEDAGENFVNYIPRTKSTASARDGLILDGLPHRACVEMPLPEIGLKSAWVRQAEGDPYLFERKKDGSFVPKFRFECKNTALAYVYLSDSQGPKGDRGDSGQPGASVKGDKGDKGDPGPSGETKVIIQQVQVEVPRCVTCSQSLHKSWLKRNWPKVAGVVAVGAAAYFGARAAGVGRKRNETPPPPPQPGKNEVIIIRTGP